MRNIIYFLPFFFSSLAFANPSNDLQVSAIVEKGCNLSMQDINFGILTTNDLKNTVSMDSPVILNCSKNTNLEFSLTTPISKSTSTYGGVPLTLNGNGNLTDLDKVLLMKLDSSRLVSSSEYTIIQSATNHQIGESHWNFHNKLNIKTLSSKPITLVLVGKLSPYFSSKYFSIEGGNYSNSLILQVTY